MRIHRSVCKWLLGTAWLLLILVPSFQSVRAQTTSADELEILRNLPPDQRDAIINRVIGGTSSTGSIGGVPSQTPTPQPGTVPRVLPDQGDTDNGVPVLKAEDYILIEIDFDLPDTPSPTQAAKEAAQANAGQGGVASTGMPATSASSAVPATSSNAGGAVAQTAKPLDPAALDEEDRERLEHTIQQIRGKNPYQLSRDGVLFLPGFSGIPIAGLTEAKAALRLHSEPALNRLELRVTRLPLKGTGVEALQPFGYDLFEQTTAPLMGDSTAPVPANYTVGPGDVLQVQLFGNQDRAFSLTVGRDGVVSFPEIGPIVVAGQRFETVKKEIEARVARQMIGVQASVSIAAVRGIQVFVVGEARFPGSYTLSGLATITSALYAAGGVTRVGSLRNIELKRHGALVGKLDLYDLLLQGDTSHDFKLAAGDAIFIPPVGPTASIDGEVHRPAIYELQGEVGVADLIQLAGGLTPEADTARGTVAHIDENGRRVMLAADLKGLNRQPLHNGDAVRISRLRPTLDDAVSLEGHVYRAGPVAWHEGLRLSDVVRSIDDLQPNADVNYVLIRRELDSDRRIAVLSADLAAALRKPGDKADVMLAPRDRIIVFDKEAGRERVIGPLLEELRLQGNIRQPTEVVRINGHAKAPGDYPLEPNMRVSDLIRAGGSLGDAAFGTSAELTRYVVKDGEARQTELIPIDLAAVLRGDPQADLLLRPFDSLSIKGVPEWGDPEEIELSGEVRFPGTYEIRRGETLRSVLARAGGLTSYAFAEGSVFTREELKVREQQQLDMLADRLQNDLATLALQGVAANQSQAAGALSVGQSLLSQLRSAKAVGRLVIDIRHAMNAAPGSPDDVVLHGGDKLLVPKLRQEVMVLGEVQNSTSHLYRRGLARDEYVALSGGVTRKADKGRIYVVRADGSVVISNSSRWFRNGGNVSIRPGDTVVVPLDTERLPALPFWQAVTQILYNVAISVAAVHSFR